MGMGTGGNGNVKSHSRTSLVVIPSETAATQTLAIQYFRVSTSPSKCLWRNMQKLDRRMMGIMMFSGCLSAVRVCVHACDELHSLRKQHKHKSSILQCDALDAYNDSFLLAVRV